MFYNIILIYYIVCLVYIVLRFLARKKNIFIKSLILMFCPIIGLFLIFYMEKNQKNQSEKNLDGLIRKLKDQDQDFLLLSDIDEEINIVSIEDALLINSHDTRRKMILDYLKGDSLQNIDVLKLALANDDTETTHYAASAILEAKRKLLNTMQELESVISEDPFDLDVLSAYAEVLNLYIKVEFLDENTRFKFMNYYSQTLERMIELEPQQIHYYIDKINCDIGLKEFQKAKKYIEKVIKLFPENEESYFLSMKLSYLLRNKEEINDILKSLRSSKVTLSPSGLKKVRFWLKGDNT